ncbi:MAG: hypothetical protein IE891_09565 [Flavobacteriaceae bacterium]|nr:hypothetical protein [Flavobacteriaceae bacterium]
MASVKNLKKEINYVLGDLVDIVYVWEITNGGKPTEKTDEIVDSIYSIYDEMLAKINNRGVENRKAHLKQVRKDFEEFANQVVAKINDLN